MDKTLNHEAIEEKCAERGLNQSSIAAQLGLSRNAVSKWFNNQSFPRPAELLKLGRLLGLRHSEIVEATKTVEEPLVAFRKRGAGKTTDKHLSRAKDMGYMLNPVADFLDFNRFIGPPSLKNPSTDYRYLQDLASDIRRDLKIGGSTKIDFNDLIGLFHKYQSVIVPTLWGTKSKHENALHIYLPKSQTTWIYLNLDVELHDFKFWMAHELAHVMAIDLLEEGNQEAAEDFSDALAGTLLYPENNAKLAYQSYRKLRSDKSRMGLLCELAEEVQISPNSVYLEVQRYAQCQGLPFVEVDKKAFYASIAQFNKRFPTVSEILFDGKAPTADHFMRVAQETFGTDAFKALGEYVSKKQPSPAAIAAMLGVNPMDGHAYAEILSR